MEALLAELPLWARSLFYVGLVVGGLFMFFMGKNRSAAPQETGETFSLKAAMVDNRAIEKLSGEVAGQSIAIMEQTAAIKAQTAATLTLAGHITQFMAAQEEAEDKRAERERDTLERENDRLKRENEEWKRREDPMRRDQR